MKIIYDENRIINNELYSIVTLLIIRYILSVPVMRSKKSERILSKVVNIFFETYWFLFCHSSDDRKIASY